MQYIYLTKIGGCTYKSLVDAYMTRLVNRLDVFAKQWIAKDGSLVYIPNYYKNDNPPKLTDHQVIRHLEHRQTIALAATDEKDMSRWACWDLDSNDDRLTVIEEFLRDAGFSTMRTEPSCPEKGGHLFLSLVEPVPAVILHFFHCAVVDELGLSTKDLEFYPKWNARKETASYSQVRAPLGKHQKAEANGAVEYFIGPDRNLQAQLAWLEKQPYNAVTEIIEVGLAKQKMYQQERARLESALKASYVCNRGKLNFEPVNWLSVIPEYEMKWCGNDYAAPCKLCQSIGLDRSGDNLRISSDGTKVNCVTNGINAMHSTGDIYRFYLS